jgi:hypothetical protein
MNRPRQCAICGERSDGMMVMGQHICADCQTLLDDPRKRAFGGGTERRIAGTRAARRLELAKAKE